jgi:hypothetical protein
MGVSVGRRGLGACGRTSIVIGLTLAALVAGLALASSASAAAPVCVDRTYEVESNQNLTLHIQEPAGPCTDPDGPTTYSLSSFTLPAHGSLSPGPGGTFIYRSTSGYTGPDSLTFSVSDQNGETSNTARVDINVTPGTPNAAPVCADASYTTPMERRLILDPDDSCTDAEGDPLTANTQTLPQHGFLTLGPNGTAIYRPAAGYTGPDSFTWRAHDGGQFSNLVTVSIEVEPGPPNEPPTCPVTNVFVPRGSFADVVGNCVDPDGDPVQYSLGQFPTGGFLQILSLSSVRYTPCTGAGTPAPPPGAFGPPLTCAGATTDDSFTFAASDGYSSSGEVLVDITVVDPGPGTIETAPDATPDDPFTAAVTTTQPGPVTVDVRDTTATPPTGYFFLDQEFDIKAPPSNDVNNPLRLVFTIDSSQVPGQPVVVFRDGVPVDECEGAAGVADPDPCFEVDPQGNGDLRIEVLTTHASIWNLGVSDTPPPADGDEDGVPDDEDNCPASANPDQVDTDMDGLGDACDSNDDNDGVDDVDDDCGLQPGEADNGCPMPVTKDQCKGDRWLTGYGTTFTTQGDCVSFVATGGRNAPQ